MLPVSYGLAAEVLYAELRAVSGLRVATPYKVVKQSSHRPVRW